MKNGVRTFIWPEPKYVGDSGCRFDGIYHLPRQIDDDDDDDEGGHKYGKKCNNKEDIISRKIKNFTRIRDLW